MQVISIIGQKGGSGKTTLAEIISVAAMRDGIEVLGIDLDPQVSFASWYDRRGQDSAPLVIDAQHGRLQHALDTAAGQGVQLCIIDTAGRAEGALHAAIKAADLVLIPLQPTLPDLVTAEAVLDAIRFAGNPQHFAVLTRVKSRGTRHSDTAEWLEEKGLTVCPHVIGDRVTYQDAAAVGQTPQEYEPGGKAAEECAGVHKFIMSHIQNIKTKGAAA